LQAVENISKAADELVATSNPAAGKRLKALNKAWARQLRLDVASGTGPAPLAEGVPSPKEYVSGIRRMSPAERDAGVPRDFSRGKAMDQGPALEAERVLGDRPSREGSLKGVGLGLGALATGAGGVAVGSTSLLAAPAILAGVGITAYTPGLKRLTQTMLDGKLGASADVILATIRRDPEMRKAGATIPSEALQKLITQVIRAKAQGGN